ncbi:hypothetical protein J2Z76_001308 [Sedimentibacter acidaminivorans]|uniref:Lipoprotein YerB n=1 Tax=Sedimentibacter acidaminivorans TaxID=913099 RepID=A0ABS4GCQ2_9FIRM|nr:DUF3048 domain-containing protein [Sedimentibacter acidaminivorans]MBP1925449.1 hypothetical protein [Sedimentibacter acidaminivorans]
MKNKILITILLLFVIAITVSCKKNDSEVSKEENIIIEQQNKLDLEKTETQENKSEETNLEDDVNKVISPLDGLKYYEEQLQRRPVVISIDNHPDARWQAGLNQAEIIYECEVEFPYTRYLCVFLACEPERVGPVRSARPYLVNYALENDGIFVHVGGSQDAFNEIYRLSVADVDGLYSGAMWRYYDTGKFAPHNMYTVLKSIRDEAEMRGYRINSQFEGYKFNDKSFNISEKYKNVSKAAKICISYNKFNTTDYMYDTENSLYQRYKDGEKHIDELDGKQLSAKNIMLLETTKEVLDNEGRLFIETVGSGEGIYITNGEAVEITWNKKSEKSRTNFYIGQDELVLNPGNTWIQVLSNINLVNIE